MQAGPTKPREVIALYPGTFDLLTHGHLDVIRRAAVMFGRLIVAVARNDKKAPFFTPDERVEMLREAVQDLPTVDVTSFEGLTVDFARELGASVIVRGLRAVSDFEFELQMALMNKQLHPNVETIFLIASSDQIFISSSIVKEVSRLGGDIEAFVPRQVAERLRAKTDSLRP